jgi:hypothetical protein
MTNLVDAYLRLLPTQLLIACVFGLFYIVIALLAKAALGNRAIWVCLAVCVPVLTASCIYKLSGLGLRAPSAVGRMFYLIVVGIAVVGIPLWYSARALLWIDRRAPEAGPVTQGAAAWVVGIAATPLALTAVFAIDAVASNFGFGGFVR